MHKLLMLAAAAGLLPLAGQPQTPVQSQQSALRAAMEPSIAQQRLAIQKQIQAAVPAADSFFFLPDLPVLRLPPPCDPLPAAELDPLIETASRREGLKPRLIRAVIEQESDSRPCAVSSKGAMGLMQLMPGTAETLKVKDPFDPKENIDAGARFLKQLLTRYHNDLSLALGAYNAGPLNVDSQSAVPAFPETQQYVKEILRAASEQ